MAVIIQNPVQTCHYALEGLTQWATRMIPTLFPFMILSSMMLCSGADRQFGSFFKHIFSALLPLNLYGYYAVFVGFVCGFPMGAKVVSELYQSGKLSRQEAHMLAGFCNNIGPAYFLGLVFPMLKGCGYKNAFPFLAGMYAIPLIYGILLSQYQKKHSASTVQAPTLSAQKNTLPAGLFSRICMDNIQSLLLLGGYVTFINALRVIFDYFPLSESGKAIAGGFLEIIGGIPAIYHTNLPAKSKAFWIMLVLSFNGISCMLQAVSFLERAKLSVLHYLIHKLILLCICTFYYALLLLL